MTTADTAVHSAACSWTTVTTEKGTVPPPTAQFADTVTATAILERTAAVGFHGFECLSALVAAQGQNSSPPDIMRTAPRMDSTIMDDLCNGICLTAADIGVGEYGDMIAYAHPDCPEHGNPLEYDIAEDTCGSDDETLRYVREEDIK